MDRLQILPVATILVLTYAAVGGALVVLSAVTHVDPQLALSFKTYLGEMTIATAGLAVGRGLAAKPDRLPARRRGRA